MADDALSSALAALGLGGGDAAATLSALPDPLVLRILAHLDGPDLARRARLRGRGCGRDSVSKGSCLTKAPRRLAVGGEQRLRRLAATDSLWAALCARRWGASCTAEVRRRRCAGGTFLAASLRACRFRPDASPQLYGGRWQDCYAARHALPERLLTCYDRCGDEAKPLSPPH